MFGILRGAFIGFLVLSLVYVLVATYSRSVRREKLEKAWDTDPAREGAATADRDAYIKAGMTFYESGLRKKLIWLVYVIPAVVVMATVYLVNYQ